MAKGHAFTCIKNRCEGITPEVCIARQYKRGSNAMSLSIVYPECAADSCPQGAEVAAFHSELVPERKLHGPRKKIKCPACGTIFKPWLKNQKHCDRHCADIARRPDRSTPSNTPAPDTPSSPSPIGHTGAHDLPNSLVGPGELVPKKVPA